MMDNPGGDQIMRPTKLKERPEFDDKLTKRDKCEDSGDAKNLSSGFAQTLDLQIKKLKRSLEGWREIILSTQSILLWEKQWHPGALFGTSTLVFLFLWLMDPSLLTTISVLGLIITIGDYMVPTVLSGFFRNENWTGAHEKRFDDLCRKLVLYYTHTSTMIASFYLMRTVRPKVYYAVLMISLITLAWLGSSVNNLLLTYITVSWLLLVPGMEHKGLLCKYTECFTARMRDALKGTTVKQD